MFTSRGPLHDRSRVAKADFPGRAPAVHAGNRKPRFRRRRARRKGASGREPLATTGSKDQQRRIGDPRRRRMGQKRRRRSCRPHCSPSLALLTVLRRARVSRSVAGARRIAGKNRSGGTSDEDAKQRTGHRARRRAPAAAAAR